VDGVQVLFGSMNLNYRSFRHDLEVAAVVEDKALARQVIERVFEPYLQISHRVHSPPETPWNLLYWLIKPFT
jgi:phosphatidylserine/phosphatidylglycerophosphate/cardiolipin synthase-like enzyme